MDVTSLTAALKQLNEAIAGNRIEDAVQNMEDMKAKVEPTEDLLRATKAGSVLARHRNNSDARISALAKDMVKLWKEAIESQRKRKRDRDDGGAEDGEEAKKVKTESGASPAAGGANVTVKVSPPQTNGADTKPDVKPKAEPSPSNDKKPKLEAPAPPVASGSRSPSPSSTAAAPKETVFETIDKDRKVPRTAKSDQMTHLEADSEGIISRADPVRDKCVVMIYDALAGDSNADSSILAERAVGLERAVFELFSYTTSNDYRGKLRSLFLNIKDKTNPGLRNKIVLGSLRYEEVVVMTKEEMASASVKAMNQKIAKDNLFKAKAVGETQTETTVFKCTKCGQRKCSFYQMQTRSADEPMTTFVTCLNCGNKWKFC